MPGTHIQSNSPVKNSPDIKSLRRSNSDFLRTSYDKLKEDYLSANLRVSEEQTTANDITANETTSPSRLPLSPNFHNVLSHEKLDYTLDYYQKSLNFDDEELYLTVGVS